MKTQTQKANAEYRRARIRAERSGRASEEYRRLRVQRQMERAVSEILRGHEDTEK